MSANTRLDDLGHLIKVKANLKVACGCGHVHVYDARRVARYAMLRCWNSTLEAMTHRFKCRSCGRVGRLSATPDSPTPDDPFPKSEEAWKRLQRRLRG